MILFNLYTGSKNSPYFNGGPSFIKNFVFCIKYENWFSCEVSSHSISFWHKRNTRKLSFFIFKYSFVCALNSFRSILLSILISKTKRNKKNIKKIPQYFMQSKYYKIFYKFLFRILQIAYKIIFLEFSLLLSLISNNKYISL